MPDTVPHAPVLRGYNGFQVSRNQAGIGPERSGVVRNRSKRAASHHFEPVASLSKGFGEASGQSSWPSCQEPVLVERRKAGRAARKEAVMLEALSLAAGLSWASGLRLYLTVFVAGLFERMGLVHLPDTLSVLGSPWVIGVAAALAIVEFFADKIPAFDSLWDAVHTFIRIPAGAMLAVGAIGHADPVMLTIAALAGGTLAGAAHLAKAGTRALINLSPEPFSNWVASTTEDLGALIGITLALFVPVLFLFLIVAFLLFAGWALPRLVRGVRGGVSRMANHMVPRLNPRINSRINPLPSKHD
jgi:hypothetical protein